MNPFQNYGTRSIPPRCRCQTPRDLNALGGEPRDVVNDIVSGNAGNAFIQSPEIMIRGSGIKGAGGSGILAVNAGNGNAGIVDIKVGSLFHCDGAKLPRQQPGERAVVFSFMPTTSPCRMASSFLMHRETALGGVTLVTDFLAFFWCFWMKVALPPMPRTTLVAGYLFRPTPSCHRMMQLSVQPRPRAGV